VGLLDRLFKTKEPQKNCDWCGTDFTGPGVESEGLLYCGEACLAAKEAPAVEPELRSVHAARKLTLEDARAALATARLELRHFKKVVRGSVESNAVIASPTAEGDLNQREFEFWRSLDDIRRALVEAGRDIAEYDAQREGSMVNSIELRHDTALSGGIGLRGPKIVATKTVTADFAGGNIQRMAEAIEALARALE
jgi:hypothetical protein